MKYGIDYRYLAKGAKTLADNTRQVDVEVDEKQFTLIPNVGDYVDIPSETDDIREVAYPVLRHRLVTTFNADAEGVTRDQIIKKLIDAVPLPQEEAVARARR